MSSIDELMRVLQFGDSILPVGAFSFSNGLESAIEVGVVQDRESLQAYVQSCLNSAATSDGIGMLHAHRAAHLGSVNQLRQIDQAIFNRKLNEEMRTMTVRMGRKLAELAEHVLSEPLISTWLDVIKSSETPGTFPVAQGLVFALLGLSEQVAFAAHQYGLASMMLSAAVRLMRVTHLETQAMLFQLNAVSAEQYQDIAECNLEDMAAFAPLWDTLASIHIKANVRMFMN